MKKRLPATGAAHLVVIRHRAGFQIRHRARPWDLAVQRLAGEQVGIVVRQRTLDLKSLLQIFRDFFSLPLVMPCR